MQEFLSNNESKTKEFAKKLASRLVQGSFLAVYGDLGVGKTAFVQGLAEGLGVRESIISPTYTILRVYESGRLPLYHFDVYRVADPEEMDYIGCDEYFFGSGVCLIEWGELISEIIPENAVWIKIEKNLDKGIDYRKITVEGARK